MKAFVFATIVAAAFAGAAHAASLEDLKASYKSHCLHEMGGDTRGPKICKCVVKTIDETIGADQLELAYGVMVADDDGLDDGAAASSLGLTVENYVELRDQLRDMEKGIRKSCSKATN